MTIARVAVALAGSLALAACVGRPVAQVPGAPDVPIVVQVLAINDIHGNLEPPKIAIDAPERDGTVTRVPAGGVAYLATAAKKLRAGHPHTLTVSAGDMIGGSPLISALFLDEPTIEAMEEVGVEYNAVGNHEFDKGTSELLRMQAGGCARHSSRQPCSVEPFDGADFKFLAANVRTASGETVFPGTAVKDFGAVQVGLIGMTLKETATLVTPAGVAGLTFADEAQAANAAVPGLVAAGADAIVLLIHQGARTTGGYNDPTCPGLSGDLLPILDRLDPAIDVIVSGHTHQAYACDYRRPDGKTLLVTSAGRYGTLISDIRLTFEPAGKLRQASATNHIVQSQPFVAPDGPVPLAQAIAQFSPDPATAALVSRYAAAASVEAARPIGRLQGPVTRRQSADREQTAGNLIADAQLVAGRSAGAQLALMNPGGVRADLVPGPDGTVTYGQIFAVQPFGNSVVVTSLSGAQLKALLEQQFASGGNSADRPNILLPSRGFEFAFDLSRPAGDRIVRMRLNGRNIVPQGQYRVAVNNFLATGGDNFSVLVNGTDSVDVGLDLNALEAWLRAGALVPELGRISDRTPKN